MSKKSRDKGKLFEREIVRALKLFGFDAERSAPLQANKTLGEPDIRSKDLGLIECKRRASGFNLVYNAIENADCAVIRDDRKRPLIVFRLEDYLRKHERGAV